MLLSFFQDFKPIFTSLSPNTEKDDVFLAFKLLFQPWKWKHPKFSATAENMIFQLEEEFKKYLGVKYAISFNSGRSALMAILKSLNLKKNEELLLQAFTCNAAVNPIIWSGLKPIFVDCEKETLNIAIEDLKKKLTPKSKALMVQHTFGLPVNLDEVLKICQENDLFLIEDCAHSLGADYNGKKIGTFGNAAFFSFGRDKIISSVYGGMVVTNDDLLGQKIRDFQKECNFPSCFWIFQQLLHPILINYLILPLYNIFGIGKWILLFFQKIKILSKAVSDSEKRGEKPNYFPQKLPNVLAILALNQLKKIEKFISHQKEIANFYDENLKKLSFILPQKKTGRVYMRYSLLIKKGETDKILKIARKYKIFLDDGWRKTPIVPFDTHQEKMKYDFGSCPQAEKIAKEVLNLPTHINISLKQAKKILFFLKKIENNFKL